MIRRTVLTSVGHVTARRRYYGCRACSAKQTPFERWAGLGGRSLMVHARRMVSLAGMSWSFDTAAKRLEEFYTDGLKINTVDGWREMRLSVFAKRQPTTPATPKQWDTRS
jgi:hypothetical protein